MRQLWLFCPEQAPAFHSWIATLSPDIGMKELLLDGSGWLTNRRQRFTRKP